MLFADTLVVTDFWTAFFANLPALVAAVIALLGAVAAFVQSLHNGHNAAVTKIETNGKLDGITSDVAASHAIINSQRTEMMARIDTLEKTLAARDVADARGERAAADTRIARDAADVRQDKAVREAQGHHTTDLSRGES